MRREQYREFWSTFLFGHNGLNQRAKLIAKSPIVASNATSKAPQALFYPKKKPETLEQKALQPLNREEIIKILTFRV